MRRRFGVLAAVRSRQLQIFSDPLGAMDLGGAGREREGCFATSGCHGEDWRDFCSRYLRMSGSQADKIIHLWEEFGEGFFKVAQLTRISPQTYRAIAPAVREEALHLNGEVIELRVENSRQLAEAVARHRRAKKPACRTEAYIRLAGIEDQCVEIVAELREIAFMDRTGDDWVLFKAVVSRASSALNCLLLDYGIG